MPRDDAGADLGPSPSADRTVVGQTLWLGAVAVVQLAGALAHVFVGSRVLGAAGFGSLAVIVATATLVHGLISIPGSDTVTTFASRYFADGRPGEAGAIVRFATGVSFGLASVAYVVIGSVGLLTGRWLMIDSAHLDILMLYATVGVLLAANPVAIAVLRLSNRLHLSLMVACADSLVRVLVLALVWAAGWGMAAVVSASVAGAAVSGAGLALCALISARRAGFDRLFACRSVRVPKEVFGFHIAAYGRTVIGTLGQNLDTILLAQFVGAADVGVYRAARHIADMARQPFALIRATVQPVLSQHWFGGDAVALRATVVRFTGWSILLAAVGFGVLVVLRDLIAGLMLGNDFAGVGDLVLILIPGAFVASLGILGGLPIAVGRPLAPLASSAIGLMVLAVGLLWLSPRYGAEGAAWARTSLPIVSILALLPTVVSIWRQGARS